MITFLSPSRGQGSRNYHFKFHFIHNNFSFSFQGTRCLYQMMIVLNQQQNNWLKQVRGHYDYMPMQYTSIFHDCNNDKFQMKNCIIFLFLLKTEIVGTC